MTRRDDASDPERSAIMDPARIADLPLFGENARASVAAGMTALSDTASRHATKIAALVPLARELAAKVPSGITVSNLQLAAVQRGLLTGEERGRTLSYLGAVMRRAGLHPTGEYQRSGRGPLPRKHSRNLETAGVNWHLSHRDDPRALPLADRQYNRQKTGTPQFVPPGRCLVLLTADADALWVTSWPFAEYVKHRWPGAWVNSLFRRDRGPQASKVIREAVAATRFAWGDPPSFGLITFIDADKIRHKRDPGRCYLRADFTPVGETDGGLRAFQMLPEVMPEPLPAIGTQLALGVG